MKRNKKKPLIMLLSVAIISSLFVNPCLAYNIKLTEEDDFESYENEADIVSFTPINSKTIPNDGRMTPADGYTWAERYNSDALDNKGFRPVENQEADGMIAELYNNDANQFYRVSSKAISGCSDNTIVVSGRFCIPDVSKMVNGFNFGIVPNERYSSKYFESFCSMIKVNSEGELYKSVKNDNAEWGASDELIEGAAIESNVWYNAVFIVENSATRNYEGRLFTDDKTVDIEINGGYLAKTSSNADDAGDNLRMGFRLGKAGAYENKVYVDDLSMCTTDFGYNLGIPTSVLPHIEQMGANELSLTFGNTAFVSDAFNIDNIFLEDGENSFTPVSVEYNTAEHKVILCFENALVPDHDYSIGFLDTTDIFLNKIKSFNYKTAPPSFKIRDINYKIDDDSILVLENGIITCTAEVANDLQEDVELSLIMALYKNGVMIDMSSSEMKTIPQNEDLEVTGTLNCPIEGKVSEYELITYFWNNVDGGCAKADPWCLDSLGITEIRQ